MATNNNRKSVDTMLNELDKTFEQYYLRYKKQKEPYTEIIANIKDFKNAREKQNLLIAIQNKLDSKETFLNLESNIWGLLFIIIGLFVTMVSNLILSNYEKLDFYKNFSPESYVTFVIIFVSILIFSFGLSTIPIRRKSKKKCYYKFVYDFLNQ